MKMAKWGWSASSFDDYMRDSNAKEKVQESVKTSDERIKRLLWAALLEKAEAAESHGELESENESQEEHESETEVDEPQESENMQTLSKTQIRHVPRKGSMVRMPRYKSPVLVPQQPLREDQIRSLKRIYTAPREGDYMYSPAAWRCADIHPAASFDDRIEFRMQTLPESTRFIALSYAWGDTFWDESHLTQKIYCEGKSLRITSTLHQALKRFREKWRLFQKVCFSKATDIYEPPQPHLWVDAICINQKNNEERSRMVADMGILYSRCAMLLVYLGEASKAEQRHLAHLIPSDSAYRRNPDALHDIDGILLSESNVEFLKSLIARPWFHRRWVIQEYFQGPKENRYFLIGDTMFPCDYLVHYLTKINMLQIAGPMQATEPEFLPLLQALHKYDKSQCVVPHDRLFALLHITPIQHVKPRVDYSKSVEEVYYDFAAGVVRNGHINWRDFTHLLAVATCRLTPKSVRRRLPSWVPDWRIPCSYRSGRHEWAVEASLERSLSRRLGCNNHSWYVNIVDDKYLKIWGTIIKPTSTPPNASTTPWGKWCGENVDYLLHAAEQEQTLLRLGASFSYFIPKRDLVFFLNDTGKLSRDRSMRIYELACCLSCPSESPIDSIKISSVDCWPDDWLVREETVLIR